MKGLEDGAEISGVVSECSLGTGGEEEETGEEERRGGRRRRRKKECRVVNRNGEVKTKGSEGP